MKKDMKKKMNIKKRAIDKFFSWKQTPVGVDYWGLMDNNNRCLLFMNHSVPCFGVIDFNNLSLNIVNLKDISSIIIQKEYDSYSVSEKESVVKRAIIGGVIAGGAGAIIGGTTGDTKTTSSQYVSEVRLQIHTNNMKFHTFIVICSTEQDAVDLEGIILALKNNNENTISNETNQEEQTPLVLEGITDKPKDVDDDDNASDYIKQINNARRLNKD